MSDNVPVVPGTGATSSVSTLDLSDTVFAVATGQVQRMAAMYRAGATAIEVSGSAPFPVAIASGGAPATVTLTNPAAAPLGTVAVGTLAIPTLSVIPPATVAVGTLAGLPTVTLSNPADQVSTLTDGRKAVATAGTPLALAASTACKWVAVSAFDANTQPVYVGGSDVLAASGSQKGVPLSGGQSVTIPVNNVSTVFADSRVNGEGVSFLVGA